MSSRYNSLRASKEKSLNHSATLKNAWKCLITKADDSIKRKSLRIRSGIHTQFLTFFLIKIKANFLVSRPDGFRLLLSMFTEFDNIQLPFARLRSLKFLPFGGENNVGEITLNAPSRVIYSFAIQRFIFHLNVSRECWMPKSWRRLMWKKGTKNVFHSKAFDRRTKDFSLAIPFPPSRGSINSILADSFRWKCYVTSSPVILNAHEAFCH